MEQFGVAIGDQQAANLYRISAEQGDATAQYNLASMYAFGRGVPKDEELAYFWLLLSSAHGYEDAAKQRDEIEKKLSPQQRSSAQISARNWIPKK